MPRPGSAQSTLFQDPYWPSGRDLGGRLIVSLCPRENGAGLYGDPQLWWLKVDPDQATIVASGRLIVTSGDGSTLEQEEERLSCVQRAKDGTPLLAYLARASDRSSYDLWVAPITFDESNRAPRVLQSARHRVAEGCTALALGFSADGRRIYVSLRNERQSGMLGILCCFPVSAGWIRR